MVKEKTVKKGGDQVAEEEIRQDTRTVDQIVDGMSLFDDDLMSMVFDLHGLLHRAGQGSAGQHHLPHCPFEEGVRSRHET